MSKKDNEAMTTGTTAVALYYKSGVVIACDQIGTVDSDSVSYDYCGDTVVPMKLGMLGTYRACTLAGSSGGVLRFLHDGIRDRLVEAEETEETIETVEDSANYLCERYETVGEPLHVEMIVAGWDNMRKEGAPHIWYSNDMLAINVTENKATGPGRPFAEIILARHNIGMTEEEAVKLAEEAVLDAAIRCREKGGSLDVWVIKDGKIIMNERQSMTNVAKKFRVSI
ncbi:hypothetical protein MKX03_008125 [Papaver bracteatum]|nr:hypothetical protein MKX03_008125 [Papaver bracteatum]